VVIFISELRLNQTITGSVAALIYDFSRRHRSPMIYTIEGIPLNETIQLPSGEEVSLSKDDEEDEETRTYVDDIKLYEQWMEKEGRATEEQKKEEPTKPSEQAKDKKKKKGRRKTGEEEEEDSKEKKAEKMYGDKLHFTTTDSEMGAKLKGMGFVPVIEGVISGVSGALLAKAPLSDQNVTALLVPTSTVIPSANAARTLLHLLETLIPGLTISVCELAKLESELEEVKKAIMKALPALSSGTATPPPGVYT